MAHSQSNSATKLQFGDEWVRGHQGQESPDWQYPYANPRPSPRPNLELKRLIWSRPEAGHSNNLRRRGLERPPNAALQSRATAGFPQIASGPGSSGDRPLAKSREYRATPENSKQLHLLPQCGLHRKLAIQPFSQHLLLALQFCVDQRSGNFEP
jgi:hypothetical protein